MTQIAVGDVYRQVCLALGKPARAASEVPQACVSDAPPLVKRAG
jgi:hypothetical protein